MRRITPLALIAAISALVMLAACGTSQQSAAPTAPAASPVATTAVETQADLSSVKAYLLHKTADLKHATEQLKLASDDYYVLAKANDFDYAALWANKRADTIQAVNRTRTAWKAASPLYEQMEGIVAGTPSLATYDLNIDAGTAAAEGGESVVSFDLHLPNGATLPKPGNLFGVTESALWGTVDDYAAKHVEADFDRNGVIELGDSLPDANVLKGGVDTLDATVGELAVAATTWQPTESEAFGALVANVPTVTDFVDSWKSSRFVAGANSSRDFVAISRLSDIVDNITSWQTIYGGISPMVVQADSNSDAQIQHGLSDLKTFIADVYSQEQAGKRYTPEDADLISSEAQNRATAITGQISQIAAKLHVEIQE